MKNFPRLLTTEDLAEFRHPAEWHALHRAVRSGREILAGNGYIAIRVERGGWLDSEFPEASAEMLGRFGKLGWSRFPRTGENWKSLDSVRMQMFSHGPIGFWLGDRVAPTPVWRVANEINVRLSLLQLISRLARIEVWVGTTSGVDPLWFRFSGGMGCIARDARIQPGAYQGRPFMIFSRTRDVFAGEELPHHRGPGDGRVRLQIPGSNWPPPDTSEA